MTKQINLNMLIILGFVALLLIFVFVIMAMRTEFTGVVTYKDFVFNGTMKIPTYMLWGK